MNFKEKILMKITDKIIDVCLNIEFKIDMKYRYKESKYE